MTALIDVGLEMALIGSLVLDHDQVGVVRPILPDPAAFTETRCRALYQALLGIGERGGTFDPARFGEALVGVPGADEVTKAWVADVVDSVATAANAPHYARTLRDLWLRRQVAAHAAKVQAGAQDRTIALRETVSTGVAGLVATGGGIARPVVAMSTGLWEIQEELERQALHGDVLGVGTRIPALDALTHGWRPGELTVVGARPGVGKTSFGLDCARAAADVGGVVFISLEMTAKAVRRRLLAREAMVNLWWIKNRAMMDRYLPNLTRATKTLSDIPLRIVDSGVTPGEVRMAVDAYASESRETIALVVVDYLQLMRSGRRTQNRNEEVADISWALARMAIDLDVPVMCLSQLSRDSAKQGRPPTLADLRDSGAIEQDASIVLLLHEEGDQPPDLRQADTFVTTVNVAKNRNGSTGELVTHHHRGFGRWSAVDHHREHPRAA